MLNIEEILIKFAELLGYTNNNIRLKPSQKDRIIKNENKYKTQQEKINHLFSLIKFNTLEEKNIFEDLLSIYSNLTLKFEPFINTKNEKKFHWIILKRLVIPFLAYKLANLKNENKLSFDKNMSGGLFGFLPDIRDLNNIKMPLFYLKSWLKDLYGNSYNQLYIEIDEKAFNKDRDNNNFSSANTIKDWGKKLNGRKYKLPDRSTIIKYFNIDLDYSGIFIVDENKSIDENLQKVKSFLKKKKRNINDLIHEIPNETLVKKVYENTEDISNQEKLIFIQMIKARWSKPSKKELITKFMIARAIQGFYERIIEYFDFNEYSNDIEENKALQLIYLFMYLYNIQNSRNQKNKLNNFEEKLAFEFQAYDFDDIYGSYFDSLYKDINIELTNPNKKTNEYEDIYLIKYVRFLITLDDRMEKSKKELNEWDNYFFHKFDRIENILSIYETFDRKKLIENLKNETDLLLLVNLISKFNTDISIIEEILSQMGKIAKTEFEKQIYLSQIITFYTDPYIEYNKIKRNEAKKLINEYKNISNENGFLICAHAYYHLKSKEYKKATEYFYEYFQRYIKNNKKLDGHIEILELASFSAIKSMSNDYLKTYNNFLTKIGHKKFENENSLKNQINYYI